MVERSVRRARAGFWAVAAALVAAAGCSHPEPVVADDVTAGKTVAVFPVTIRAPEGPPRVATGTMDEKGQPVTVACATCHATRPANVAARVGTPLADFHQGLVGRHGALACTACHNPADGYSTLRLADGRAVPYADVMTLCAQCHGPQFRDYQHGAHGGMAGFWDLSKGGRTRNSCIDCHDAHAPKYPTVVPARGPNDRFQTNGRGHE
jgi:hypothetical protein